MYTYRTRSILHSFYHSHNCKSMAESLESAPPACRRVATPRRQYVNSVCSYDGCGGVKSALLTCGNNGCNANNKTVHRACEVNYAHGQRLALVIFPRCSMCASIAAGKKGLTTSASTCIAGVLSLFRVYVVLAVLHTPSHRTTLLLIV